MSPGAVLVILLFSAVILGLIGLRIGAERGRGTEGFWLGFVFGPIGWIVVCVMQPTPEAEATRTRLVDAATRAAARRADRRTRECPWCVESISAAAIVCRYCGRDVEPLPADGELVAGPAAVQARRQSFDFLAQEHPSVFDAVWTAAVDVEPWPRLPTPALRAACKAVEAGGKPTDAVLAAFAATR